MDFTFWLNQSSKDPLYMQLYTFIKTEIQNGQLEAGVKLPSIRQLASHLNISKNTVEVTYQQLIAEGYVENKERVGFYVAAFDADLIPQKQSNQPLFAEVSKNEDKTFTYDFRQGKIDLDDFPYSIWRRLSNESIIAENNSTFLYGDPQGEPELRVQIAKYLYHSRGVHCSPNQIIVGAGTQSLLSLLCQLIGMDHRNVAIEEPGYDGAKMVFKNLGFNLHPIELDENGIGIEPLKNTDAKIVYVTPSHQFPMGMIMPYSKRIQLLHWAEAFNGYIVEDDYDGEFRYIGKPIPSLQGLDSTGKVIYLGTFSKSLSPALRMSYMVLPPLLLSQFKDTFPSYEPTCSKLHQKTLQLFMENGHWDRHIRKMRKTYQNKHSALVSSIKRMFGSRVQMIGSHSGLHILLKIDNQMSEAELIHSARENDVKVYATSTYWMNETNTESPMILLGFGGLTEEQIREGISRLCRAWFQ
ncbi:PLP-dependent aminotransferase family protein [Alkalihalobacillus trypoxylicola]|uniref:GntR family transcriptional regulator n=1 Tax=Alkalihalobacillus trypoxylicola TaxID=519424 RepID=A0A162CR72_9BACI|nr:PLP-dependent aminotransferase family protein [Alkalihalobacillus trypoxylicola]KYG26097.1 GntR family transcriptional regulator [Alkalihalobacillus trypoxylicola]